MDQGLFQQYRQSALKGAFAGVGTPLPWQFLLGSAAPKIIEGGFNTRLGPPSRYSKDRGELCLKDPPG